MKGSLSKTRRDAKGGRKVGSDNIKNKNKKHRLDSTRIRLIERRKNIKFCSTLVMSEKIVIL